MYALPNKQKAKRTLERPVYDVARGGSPGDHEHADDQPLYDMGTMEEDQPLYAMADPGEQMYAQPPRHRLNKLDIVQDDDVVDSYIDVTDQPTYDFGNMDDENPVYDVATNAETRM